MFNKILNLSEFDYYINNHTSSPRVELRFNFNISHNKYENFMLQSSNKLKWFQWALFILSNTF